MIRDPSDGSEYDYDPSENEPLTDEDHEAIRLGSVYWLGELRKILRGESDGPEAA